MQTKCPVFHNVLPTFSDCLLLKQAVLAPPVSAGINVLCYDWLTPCKGNSVIVVKWVVGWCPLCVWLRLETPQVISVSFLWVY